MKKLQKNKEKDNYFILGELIADYFDDKRKEIERGKKVLVDIFNLSIDNKEIYLENKS